MSCRVNRRVQHGHYWAAGAEGRIPERPPLAASGRGKRCLWHNTDRLSGQTMPLTALRREVKTGMQIATTIRRGEARTYYVTSEDQEPL